MLKHFWSRRSTVHMLSAGLAAATLGGLAGQIPMGNIGAPPQPTLSSSSPTTPAPASPIQVALAVDSSHSDKTGHSLALAIDWRNDTNKAFRRGANLTVYNDLDEAVDTQTDGEMDDLPALSKQKVKQINRKAIVISGNGMTDGYYYAALTAGVQNLQDATTGILGDRLHFVVRNNEIRPLDFTEWAVSSRGGAGLMVREPEPQPDPGVKPGPMPPRNEVRQ